MELTERKKRILRAIVEEYIATAEPVGSKALSQVTDLNISSATIRNEMADLTEMGYLEQPHTSAGRIPSASGYRLYVNELMGEHQLTVAETKRINDALNLKMAELDRVIDRAGKVLSQMTDYPVFSLSGPQKECVVQRYNLIMVEQHAFIAVIMTDGKTVHNRVLQTQDEVSETQLALLSTVLNTSFVNLSSVQLETALQEFRQKAASGAFELISLVVTFAKDALEQQQKQTVRTAGVTQLLEFPEYRSPDKAKSLMTYLTESDGESALAIPLDQTSGTNILIGPENVAEAFKDTSVVMASYDIGENMRGVIGVVGPTRMDYAKVTARLNYFAESLTRMFGKNDLPPPQEPSDEGGN